MDVPPTDQHQPPLVMVVDDDNDLRASVAEALAARGYRVAAAANGREALHRVDEEAPRLILLDMRMPVMDGWEFARVFRDRYGRSVPIAVMTAAADSKVLADEVGADSWLGKPFGLDELYEVVEDTLLD